MKTRSRWRTIFARTRVGGLLVTAFFATGLLGPWIAPYSPARHDLAHQLEAPTFAHWLGTGDNGVDLLSALLHGARFASLVALTVVSLSFALGGLVGSIAGYLGGLVDDVLMGLAEVVQAFPTIVLQIGVLAVVEEPSFVHLVIALVIPGWVLYARIARANALTLREREFVVAARALGASEPRVVFGHVAPNLVAPLVVHATTAMGGVVLAESTLSFLGLGPPRATSWGRLLDEGTAFLLLAPHVAIASGLAIALTVLGFQLTGDALRDALDPRTR